MHWVAGLAANDAQARIDFPSLAQISQGKNDIVDAFTRHHPSQLQQIEGAGVPSQTSTNLGPVHRPHLLVVKSARNHANSPRVGPIKLNQVFLVLRRSEAHTSDLQ